MKKLCKDWFSRKYNKHIVFSPNQSLYLCITHGLRTPREEVAFTSRPKIHSHSQIFRYGGSTFCLPHRPNFSDIFDLCLHWLSVVHDLIWSRLLTQTPCPSPLDFWNIQFEKSSLTNRIFFPFWTRFLQTAQAVKI